MVLGWLLLSDRFFLSDLHPVVYSMSKQTIFSGRVTVEGYGKITREDEKGLEPIELV